MKNREIIDRLNRVMQERGVTSEDIAEAYVCSGEAFIGDMGNARKYFGMKKKNGDLYASDIILFAKVCNCTTDYLLGLSDRMN